MTEENVTISIIKFLIFNDWKILSFDIPQSGTGIVFHPNEKIREKTKNKGSFIPDIVCIKGNNVLFIENKDRFYLNDFIKLSEIRKKNNYINSINSFLENKKVNIYYGIGIPNNEKFIIKSIENKEKVDFILTTDISNVSVIYVIDNLKIL